MNVYNDRPTDLHIYTYGYVHCFRNWKGRESSNEMADISRKTLNRIVSAMFLLFSFHQAVYFVIVQANKHAYMYKYIVYAYSLYA